MTWCMFLRPRPVYENDVIDHREIVEECQRRYGPPRRRRAAQRPQPQDRQVPRLLRQRGAGPGQLPHRPLGRRRPDAGRPGSTSGSAARSSRSGRGTPVGMGLSAEDDSAIALRDPAPLASAAAEQDAAGAPALASKQTVEAVKFVSALYREAMTPAVLAWDPSSNNRAMLAGQSSLVMNAISITRVRRERPAAHRPTHRVSRRRPSGHGRPARASRMPPASTSSGRFAENIDGREGVPRRSGGPRPRGVPGQRGVQLLQRSPAGFPISKALLARDPKGMPAGQVRGARRRARLDDQPRGPGPCQRGAWTRPTGPGSSTPCSPAQPPGPLRRGRGARGRPALPADLGAVEGARADLTGGPPKRGSAKLIAEGSGAAGSVPRAASTAALPLPSTSPRTKARDRAPVSAVAGSSRRITPRRSRWRTASSSARVAVGTLERGASPSARPPR